MASANDYFLYTGDPGTATTLSAPGYTIGNASITVASTAAFPTASGVIFGIDTTTTTNGVQSRVNGSYCVFAGLVTGAGTIGSLSLLSGNPQNYAAGASTRVYITVSTLHNKRLMDGLLVQHNQNGTHGAITAPSITATTGTFTNLTITGASTASGFTPVGQVLTYTGNNGNKEFTCSTPTDLTTSLSAGMKLQVTRGTVPPTQSMSFTAASSQYASKATPTGITDTGAFTIECWVYLNSYTSTVLSRDSGSASGGWALQITAAGQLQLFWRNASGNSVGNSYQSIPLKRWVHVVARADNIASALMTFFINGTQVPSVVTTAAATTRLQAGPLQVGAGNSTSFFDGYISEARVWSVAQTQAQIQANMAISLTGSETNLVALFKGNGNFTDSTANANTLVASGGAIATQASNPYNAVEYGIITKVTSTQLTIFTGTDYTIPNMTLTGAQYSQARAPYGFPASKGKWVYDFISFMDDEGAVTGAQYYTTNQRPIIPTGEWNASYRVGLYNSRSGTGFGVAQTGISTSLTGITDSRFTGAHYHLSNVSSIAQISTIAQPPIPISQTSMTQWYFFKYSQSTDTSMGFRGDLVPTILIAECAYI